MPVSVRMRLRLLRAVLLVLRLQGSQACPQFCGAHAGQVSHQNPYGGLAGVPIKAISEVLGHATSAFTADVYTEVAEELAESAAAAIAAYVPRKAKITPARASNVPAGGEDDH